MLNVSRDAQYKDVYRTIEILQHTRIFKAGRKVLLKLARQILAYRPTSFFFAHFMFKILNKMYTNYSLFLSFLWKYLELWRWFLLGLPSVYVFGLNKSRFYDGDSEIHQYWSLLLEFTHTERQASASVAAARSHWNTLWRLKIDTWRFAARCAYALRTVSVNISKKRKYNWKYRSW